MNFILFLILAFAVSPNCLLSKANCRTSSSVDRCSLDCSEIPNTRLTASEEINVCDRQCNTVAGTLFLPRPQGQNTAALFNPYYYLPGSPQGGFVTLGYRYDQTFRSENIARCLFGSPTLVFSGSKSDAHSNHDFLADNFGLSPNFKGRLQVRPEIKNHIIDITTRIDLDNVHDCLCGAYFALNASVAHSIWDLRACQTSQTPTSDKFVKFPRCYMSDVKTPVEAAGDIQTALSGNYLFGDMQSAWRFGKFKLGHTQHDTKLANVDLFLGYDFMQCDDYHIGLFVKAVAPTGTRPNGEFVFSPIIGNGHHWEFGGGLTAHYNFYETNEHLFGLYVDGCATHLFKDSQWRTFDLDSCKSEFKGLLSRYVLLKEFDENNNYAGKLINAVNFTTRKIKSSFSVQGDASLRLLYNYCGWAVGLGYNIYGRSTEKISGLCDPCGEFRNKRLGIKGVTGVCARGFKDSELTGKDKTLHATESRARALNIKQFESQNFVDNGVPLVDEETDTTFITWDSPTKPADKVVQAFDSEKDGKTAPVFVKTSTIRVKPIPALISHKVFAHVDYAWENCECYQPYLGVGGEVQFAQQNNCHVCTPNQWGIWVRGGLNF
jgi:hypothetical protein